MHRGQLVQTCGLFVAGIVLQRAAGLAAVQWLAVIAALVAAVAWQALRPSFGRSGLGAGVLAALLVVAWGGWWSARAEERLDDGLDPFIGGGPVVVEGVVVSHPEVEGDRAYIVVRVREVRQGNKAATPDARVRLTIVDPPPLKYGDVVSVRVVLRRPAPASNPGAFDYRAWLRRQGITATGFVRYARHFEVIGHDPPNPFMHAASVLRGVVQRGLFGALPSDDAAVATAIVLGDRRLLPPETEEQFRRAGVSHLLAVSGLHVGFFAFAVYAALRALRVPALGRTAAAVVAAWLYVLATGGRPPAVRAGVMATAGIVADGLGRSRDSPSALAAGALALLIDNPLLLFDVSFQLSVAATAAIVWGARSLRRILARLPGPVAGAVAVTLAAQLGVAPLLAHTFHQLSLVGLAGSLVGTPIASLLVPVGLVTGIAHAVSPTLAGWTAALARLLVGVLLALTRWLAALPWAMVDVAPPSPLFVAGWWLFWWGALRTGVSARRRRRSVLTAAVLLAVGLWAPLVSGAADELVMIVLDVGQGDAMFIQTPDGVTALIDGGGTVSASGDPMSNPGLSVVLPYLRRVGVGAVDVVINTHPDEDHLQGLLPILSQRPVSLAVDPGQEASGPSWPQYVRIVGERDVVRWIARAGDTIRLGRDTVLEVLHPDRLMRGTRSDTNNNSVVIKLVHGQTAALLTGDIEDEAQLELLRRGVDLRADVVKVPHHGSRWSLVPAFYEAVGAEVAVIPVGGNNYGHPAPEVVATLADMGMRVYRTDEDGAVILTSDGTRWTVRSVLGP